jgi:hypothetical protein
MELWRFERKRTGLTAHRIPQMRAGAAFKSRKKTHRG